MFFFPVFLRSNFMNPQISGKLVNSKYMEDNNPKFLSSRPFVRSWDCWRRVPWWWLTMSLSQVWSKHELFGLFVRGGYTTWLPGYIQISMRTGFHICICNNIHIFSMYTYTYWLCKSGSRVLICFSLVRMFILLLFTVCRTGMHRVCVECPCLGVFFKSLSWAKHEVCFNLLLVDSQKPWVLESLYVRIIH